MAEGVASVVVSRAGGGDAEVVGGGLVFGFWGVGVNARFWRIQYRGWPCASADVLREKLIATLPLGSGVFAAVLYSVDHCQSGESKWQGWLPFVEAIVDLGTAESSSVRRVAELPVRRGATELSAATPYYWDPTACWAGGGQCRHSCAGELLWAVQQRMLGKDKGYVVCSTSGRGLLEREFDCIYLDSRPSSS